MKKALTYIGVIGVLALFIATFLYAQEERTSIKKNRYTTYKTKLLKKSLSDNSVSKVMYYKDTLIYILHVVDLKEVANQMHNNIEERVKLSEYQDYYIDWISEGTNEMKEKVDEMNSEGFKYIRVEFVLEDGSIINTKKNLIKYTGKTVNLYESKLKSLK